MNISMEDFVKIADNTCDKYKDELKSIYNKIGTEIINKMHENNISLRDYINKDKTGYSDSWELIMMTQRVESRLHDGFFFDFAFTPEKHKLIDELEKNK